MMATIGGWPTSWSKREHQTMFTKIRKFFSDDSGATAIEYGLIAALVSVAAITALGAMGNSLSNMFSFVGGELDTAVQQSGAGS